MGNKKKALLNLLSIAAFFREDGPELRLFQAPQPYGEDAPTAAKSLDMNGRGYTGRRKRNRKLKRSGK